MDEVVLVWRGQSLDVIDFHAVRSIDCSCSGPPFSSVAELRLATYDVGVQSAVEDVSPDGLVDTRIRRGVGRSAAALCGRAPVDTKNNWAALNATHRRNGVKFFSASQSPGGRVIRQRFLLEPLRMYMSRQLELAIADFERKEVFWLAQGLLASDPSARRKIRVVQTTVGATDAVFSEQVRAL